MLHQRFNLQRAEALFEFVLQNRSELDKPAEGKALYFAYRNKLQLINSMNREEGVLADFQTQMEVYKCHELLLELEELKAARWSVKANQEYQILFDLCLKGALDCLEHYFISNEGESKYLSIARGYIALSERLVPGNYLSEELYGQIAFFEDRREEALNHYKNAIDAYNELRLSTEHNMRMPDAYYKLAVLLGIKEQYDSAYALVKRGLEVNEFEWEKIKVNDIVYGPKDIKRIQPFFEQNFFNLGLYELELLAGMPAMKKKALNRFEELSPYYQEEYAFHYHYANLLADQNPKQASIHYQNAIEVDSNSLDAHYAFGMLYLREAREKLNETANLKGKAKTDKLEESRQLYEVAYPKLLRAHQLAPQNSFCLLALIEACTVIGKRQEAKAYQEKYNALQKP